MSNGVQGSNLIGAGYAAAAVLSFSVTDMGVKFLSDAYALHQVVLIRAVVGSLLFLTLIMPFNGGLRVFYTRRPGAHLIRGLCVVTANMCLFLGWVLHHNLERHSQDRMPQFLILAYRFPDPLKDHLPRNRYGLQCPICLLFR